MKVIPALVLIMQIFTGDVARLDATQPIPFFVHDGKAVSGFDASDKDLAEHALDALSRESGGKLKFVRTEDEKSALIHLVWTDADSGLFGQTQRIRVNGKAGAVAFVMPDVRQLGDPLASAAVKDRLLRDTIVYLTCVHELGHAVGLGHTREFADIMYSFTYGGDFLEYFSRYRRQLKSRADIPKFSGLSSADTAALKLLYE